MGTNKDQLQAHQFMLQRVISALAVQETDPEQPPFRRPTMAAIAGIVIGILSCGAVWVFGLLVPGGNKFTATDVIAVEEETGARFVLMDGRLHPVMNYTSALLALDKHADVRMVSHATLAGIPAGVPIGIPDAPDSLPGKDQLLSGGWSVCSQPATDTQGQRTQQTVLLVGHTPDHSSALNGRGALVTAAGREYLLYQGFKHEITGNVTVALGLADKSATDVASRWLDTVPSGARVDPIAVTDAGTASTAVPGKSLVAGQLIEVNDAPDNGLDDITQPQFYLVLSDQLMSVSPLQAAVQHVLDPRANPYVPMSNRELAGAVRTPPEPSKKGGLPRSVPPVAQLDEPDAAVCALFQPGEDTPQILVSASLSAADRGSATVPPSPDGIVRVAVPAGKAALVEVMTSPTQEPGQGTIALVNDQGKLHPLLDPQHVQQVLGYDGVVPVRITEVLTGRVPAASPLGPDAARVPATGG
ncbi:type VII secretion protein EccB [Labedaea rhizosphaerae]|uniref:Type VII secretion protein EccB n=1 Tax=Labedaea rhizosphaerae TaxID=598644 RepID=A0A4R6SL54_LABRH|nr:type VII secretion protein EccB [Labedaea rhizosphaerae]TDQ04928.1 type VII secretion protein EccB [Labedaea rhizosphaerae]